MFPNPDEKPCPRCGRLVEKGSRGHTFRGEPCKDRGTCPHCEMTVYLSPKGKCLSHKVWSGADGKVIKCPGVGQVPA